MQSQDIAAAVMFGLKRAFDGAADGLLGRDKCARLKAWLTLLARSFNHECRVPEQQRVLRPGLWHICAGAASHTNVTATALAELADNVREGMPRVEFQVRLETTPRPPLLS